MMSTKPKVLVAMSGGVDSSAAAFLLKQQGYECAGVTMCLGTDRGDDPKACCSPQAVKDARSVCRELGIPHCVMDFSRELQECVIRDFIGAYKKGRTPNPCVECNKYLKFGTLLGSAINLGYDYLATGHYARITRKDGILWLSRGRDAFKDQSYFLYSIRKENLDKILFPLGELTKDEVRTIARDASLHTADKPQSQDICFIPDGDYRSFIASYIDEKEEGPILHVDGRVLGTHKGLSAFTIGQRGGLGISAPAPLYVVERETDTNTLVVGEKRHAYSCGFVAGRVNRFSSALSDGTAVQIRYPHKPALCTIEDKDDCFIVHFTEPQFAVTPGQSAVIYHEERVIGGGIIEEVINDSAAED